MKFISLWLIVALVVLSLVTYSQEQNVFSLDQLISLGLENSPLIHAEKQRMEAAQAAYNASRSFQNPIFEYNQGTAKSYDGAVTRTISGFSVSQQIENPFKRQFRIESWKKRWKAVEFSYEKVCNELKFNIKIQFYRILLLDQKRKIAKQNLQTIEEIHQLIKKRADLGEVKELEEIKLYVETLKAQKDLNQIITEKQLTEESLNSLLGNALSPNFHISGSLNHSIIPINEESLIRQALSIQPVLKEKTMEVEEVESIIRFMKWQRLPDLNLTGFSQRALDGKNLGFGVSFEIPLWNWKSPEIKEAMKKSQQKSLELEALEMEVITEVKSRIRQLHLSTNTLELFSSGLLSHAEESLKIAEVSYKEGEISLIDYLDSQRTYNSILLDFQEALFSWNSDKAALERAVGEEIR